MGGYDFLKDSGARLGILPVDKIPWKKLDHSHAKRLLWAYKLSKVESRN